MYGIVYWTGYSCQNKRQNALFWGRKLKIFLWRGQSPPHSAPAAPRPIFANPPSYFFTILTLPIHCRIRAFLLMKHYFNVVTLTSDPVTLISEEHLKRIVCDVMKLCTKFERNRTIHGRVVAITVLTWWPWTCFQCSLGSGIIFTMFDLRQLIIAFLMLIRYVTLWP